MNTTLLNTIAAITVKILCTDKHGEVWVGTGIRITADTFITCAHVVLGNSRLRGVVEAAKKEHPEWTEEEVWKQEQKAVQRLAILDKENKEHPAEILWIEPDSDVACIRADVQGPIADIDQSASMTPGQEVLLFGFPYAIDTESRNWPFAVYPGMVSRMVEGYVGAATKREYIEIAGVSFGGNSGGPIVDRQTGKIIGMVHGHMTWGRDDVIVRDESKPEKMDIGNTETPIAVTYGSGWNFINHHLTQSR